MKTSDPWWPLTDGSWIEYQYFKVKGQVYEKDLAVSISEWKLLNTFKVSTKCRLCNCGNHNFFDTVYSGGGKLTEYEYTHLGKKYIGEAMNELGGVYKPPLPKLLNEKKVQLWEFDATSRYKCPYAPEGKFKVRFAMRGLKEWGVFGKCWQTGLSENGPTVFNYAFKEGVGLVDCWYMDKNTNEGYEFYAIKWGGQ